MSGPKIPLTPASGSASVNIHAQTNHGYIAGIQNGPTSITFNTSTVTDASFLQALQVNPGDLRTNAIESVSDRIIPACWDWILDHAAYKSWLNAVDSRLLWISGGPGKGKTVMAISLVAELAASKDAVVCDFFCRHMDDRGNTASAILRGLIHGLAQNQRHLVGFIRDKYKTPEDVSSAQFKELWSLLREMVAGFKGPKAIYLVIDAVDECRDEPEILKLLEFIKRDPFKLSQTSIRWLITSRPSSELERIIGTHFGMNTIDLSKEEKVSQSVEAFIKHVVNGMDGWNKKSKDDVLSFLGQGTESTFLYVSLVWKELYRVPEWEVSTRLATLQNNPNSVLHQMYRLMLDRTLATDEKSGNTYRQDILRVVLVAMRVLSLEELAITAGLPQQPHGYNDGSLENGEIAELIQQCGHFLLLQGGKVYFFHKSARDYLLAADGESTLLSPLHLLDHARIAHRYLAGHCSTLKPRHFPDLESIVNRKLQRSEVQRLQDTSYIHCHWITHVLKAGDHFTDYLLVSAFFRNHFLPWLEIMGYLGELSRSIQMIQGLMSASAMVWTWQGLAEIDPVARASLADILYDAFRFALRCRDSIASDPTQDDGGGFDRDIVLSSDAKICGTRASGQSVLWETTTGLRKIRLAGRTTFLQYLGTLSPWAFSADSAIAMAIVEETLVLVNTTSLEPPVYTKMGGQVRGVDSAVFTFNRDNTMLAIALRPTQDGIYLIDTRSGFVLHILQSPHSVGALAFSPAGRLAAGPAETEDRRLLLWDAPYTGRCIPIVLPEGKRGLLGTLASAFHLSSGKDTRWGVRMISWSPEGESMVMAGASWRPKDFEKKGLMDHHVFKITGIDNALPRSRLHWTCPSRLGARGRFSTYCRNLSDPTALCILDRHHFAAAWPMCTVIGTPNGCFTLRRLGDRVHSLRFSSDKKFVLINEVAVELDNLAEHQQAPCLAYSDSWVSWDRTEIVRLPHDLHWGDYDIGSCSTPGCLAISDSSAGGMLFLSPGVTVTLGRDGGKGRPKKEDKVRPVEAGGVLEGRTGAPGSAGGPGVMMEELGMFDLLSWPLKV
ncbi:uncharacterized protein DNG_07526 [Cephalotrichum gorgonifer]|uniref:NACHT domain-containing protein n=1 Tax=Cephalotrichum gorgonifer TaxID=2041049 RepID=A0AAE8N1T1_9PEZI|nr:uncharacterized protein DNG_07526 [Cephalotrichum gorgonifer]